MGRHTVGSEQTRADGIGAERRRSVGKQSVRRIRAFSRSIAIASGPVQIPPPRPSSLETTEVRFPTLRHGPASVNDSPALHLRERAAPRPVRRASRPPPRGRSVRGARKRSATENDECPASCVTATRRTPFHDEVAAIRVAADVPLIGGKLRELERSPHRLLHFVLLQGVALRRRPDHGEPSRRECRERAFDDRRRHRHGARPTVLRGLEGIFSRRSARR